MKRPKPVHEIYRDLMRINEQLVGLEEELRKYEIFVLPESSEAQLTASHCVRESIKKLQPLLHRPELEDWDKPEQRVLAAPLSLIPPERHLPDPDDDAARKRRGWFRD